MVGAAKAAFVSFIRTLLVKSKNSKVENEATKSRNNTSTGKDGILTSFPPISGTSKVGIMTAVPRDSM
jgi:hypothetical protein